MSRCGWCKDAPWRLECALCDPRWRMKFCTACAARWHARGVAQEHEVADLSGVKRPYRDWAREFEDGQTSTEAQSDGGTEHSVGQQEREGQQQPRYDDAEAEGEPEMGAPSSPVAGDDSSTALNDAEANREPETAIELPLEQEDEPTTARSSIGDVPSSSRRKAADLEVLVSRFPTEDPDSHAALTMLTLRAVREQDALLCAYFNKCEETECARAFALHRRHKEAKTKSLYGADAGEDEVTQWTLAFAIHLDECISTTCPFCIRVRLRVNVGSMHAMDRLLAVQRRELQHVADGVSSESNASDAAQRGFAVESRRNMLTLQIAKIGRRRQQHMDMSRKLSRLEGEHVLRGFSFPPFHWHFDRDDKSSDVLGVEIMKRLEPGSLPGGSVDGTTTTDVNGEDQPMPNAGESEAATTTVASTAVETTSNEAMVNAIDEVRDKASTSAEPVMASDATQPDAAANASGSDAAQPDGDADTPAFYESDLIDKLLSAKQAAPDDASAQHALDEALALGCAIVDAGFCSPARASRCLLRCQTILTHLQHHVDLDVCSDTMCDAVEHHFAHLSQCQSRSSDVACEYCLRVRERELARAVEALEMEQPEADARVQSVINAMTDSLTDDPPAEREQVIVQLEDELEQAEENKRSLAEKLSAERLELRRVRRRLDREGLFSSATAQRLPPHFIKVLK